MKKEPVVTFEPSLASSVHFIHIDGKSTGELVNLDCYRRLDDYKKEVDDMIDRLLKKEDTKIPDLTCDEVIQFLGEHKTTICSQASRNVVKRMMIDGLGNFTVILGMNDIKYEGRVLEEAVNAYNLILIRTWKSY